MDNVYQLLPFDLSGSRSKNRFRNEMLWGLEKIYDIYKTGKDFCVVFDYVCDIEVHLDEGYEFYQIKTSNGASPYSLNHIIKPDKTGKSILGKIYILKDLVDKSGKKTCKIAIVVNSPLKTDKKTYTDITEFEFNELESDLKVKISDAIRKELDLDEEINYENIYFLHSSMDLVNPHDSLLGKTVRFFINTFGEEPKKVNLLFRSLEDTIIMKATYEKQCKTMIELYEKKGLSKAEFNKIIKTYIQIADDTVYRAKDIINEFYPVFSDRIQMKSALTKIVQELTINKKLYEKQSEIIDYIRGTLQDHHETIPEYIKFLVERYTRTFPVEYSIYEKQAIMVLVIAQFEEGIYETVTNS